MNSWMTGLIKKTVNFLEQPYPFLYAVFSLFIAINLRILLEGFSCREYVGEGMYYIASFSYISGALAFVLLVYCGTKEKIEKICRVVFSGWILLIIPPIFDLCFTLGKGSQAPYLLPGQCENPWLSFITFFGPFKKILVSSSGVSLGQLIEMSLAVILVFFYMLIKTNKVIKSLFFAFLFYVFMFIYMALPFIFQALKINYLYPNVLSSLYLLSIFIFGIVIFYLYNRELFVNLIKNIGVFRLLHYELMFILGIIFSCIYSPSVFDVSQISIIRGLLILIAIFLANAAFSLPRGIALVMSVLAVVYARAVDFLVLFYILLFLGNHFLYSMPPLRIKRFTFFSKILLSGNSLILVLLGFNFAGASFKFFPSWPVIYFLICFTAAINFVDLKGYLADKEAGIKTLPVIMGLRQSKLTIGVFFLISYVTVYLIIPKFSALIVCLGFGIMQFFLINRQRYDERLVFIVYLASLFLFMVYLAPQALRHIRVLMAPAG